MLSVFPKLCTRTFSANCPLPTLTYAKCVEISGEDLSWTAKQSQKREIRGKKHEESSLFVVGQIKTDRNSG